MRPTIVTKMALVLLLPSLGTLGVLAFFVSCLETTSADGLFIDTASRQRMLATQLLVYAHRGHS